MIAEAWELLLAEGRSSTLLRGTGQEGETGAVSPSCHCAGQSAGPRTSQARSYTGALELTANAAERAFLAPRLGEVTRGDGAEPVPD